MIFSEIFKNFEIRDTSFLFYKYEPYKEFNEEFKRLPFDLGILETFIRDKLKNIKADSTYYGLELESDIFVDNKKFKLLFELIPNYKPKSYDLKIDILGNGYAEILEDLDNYYPEFRKVMLENIKNYNEKLDKGKLSGLQIEKAIMSEYNQEVHDIDTWNMFYSKNPSDIIVHISSEDKKIKERLIYGNKNKFAQRLNMLQPYIIKFAEYAKEANVEISQGSIAILPKNKKAMGDFMGKLRKKINLAVEKAYLNKSDYEEKLSEAFLD
ncbi:MAG: hypothetical protein AABX17_03910 [Nanoarchaeota archaeon]